jgi:hypothetical protein
LFEDDDFMFVNTAQIEAIRQQRREEIQRGEERDSVNDVIQLEEDDDSGSDGQEAMSTPFSAMREILDSTPIES